MRTASNKSSIVSPSLSLASIVVASWSVLFRSISKSSWKSFVFPLDSSSFFFKSSVLVQPSSISYTQSRFLSRQHWYVGRWPVHFAFRFWHRVQALRTCSGGPRFLLDGPCLLVSADDRVFRFTGWDENSGAWASQMRSRPLLRQVWHVGRSPEHLDFFPRHRRHALFAISVGSPDSFAWSHGAPLSSSVGGWLEGFLSHPYDPVE